LQSCIRTYKQPFRSHGGIL